MGPCTFLAAALSSLVGTYWLLQGQALARELLNRGAPPGWITTYAPTCFVTSDSLVCQALLVSRSNLAIGSVDDLRVSWRDASRSGAFKAIPASGGPPPAVQTPRAETGTFWNLRANEPLPLSIALSRSDACGMVAAVQDLRRRVPPFGSDAPSLELEVFVTWQSGYGLVARDDAALRKPDVRIYVTDPFLEQDLQKFCELAR